jgi:hypothetical protein
LLSVRDWSLLWILYPVALIWVAARQSRALSLQLFALVGLPLALYSSVYIFSSWAVFQDHIDTSLPRLVSDVALVGLLTVGISMRAILRRAG